MQLGVGREFPRGGGSVIQLRDGQPSLWHAGLAKEIEDLCEPWRKQADGLLEDAALVESV